MTPSHLDPEHLVLLGCALAQPGAALDDALTPLLGPAFRWDRFVRAATAARVRPQVIAVLGPLLARLPAARDAHEGMQVVANANEGHALFLLAELLAAIEALHLANVAALPFKGPAFAELVGAGAALREMDDLDFLLPPERVGDAVRALAGLGYEASVPRHAIDSRWLRGAGHELALGRPRDGMLIELQWRLAPPWYPEPCSVDEAIAQSTPRQLRGPRIHWPRAEHLLLMHIADGMKSCGGGIRWVGDIADIVRRHPELRWDDLCAIAESHGALDSVRIGLSAAQGLCEMVATRLRRPELALDVGPLGAALAAEARRAGRLRTAVELIQARIATDAPKARAGTSFRWALRTADRPVTAAAAVLRYLSGPAMADLGTMPEPSGSSLAVRLRATRRRLGRGS